MSLWSIFISIFVFLFIAPAKTHAYIDPGSGSYMLQFLLALIVGGSFALRAHLSSAVKSFKNHFFKKKETSTRGTDEK